MREREEGPDLGLKGEGGREEEERRGTKGSTVVVVVFDVDLNDTCVFSGCVAAMHLIKRRPPPCACEQGPPAPSLMAMADSVPVHKDVQRHVTGNVGLPDQMCTASSVSLSPRIVITWIGHAPLMKSRINTPLLGRERLNQVRHYVV